MCLSPYFFASVIHVTWILLDIPCISCHKSTGVWSKSTPNSMTIPCYLSRFYLFSICPYMTWILQKFKSWNFHGMIEKMIHWISSDLVIFNKTAKRHKKLRFTFFAGIVWFIFTLSVSPFEWNMIR